MEDEYFSTISINTASNRCESSSSASTVILKRDDLVPEDNEDLPTIKDEPLSEPPSPCIPYQSSCDIVDDKNKIIMPIQSLQFTNTQQTSDSEEEDEECDMVYQYRAIYPVIQIFREIKSHSNHI